MTKHVLLHEIRRCPLFEADSVQLLAHPKNTSGDIVRRYEIGVTVMGTDVGGVCVDFGCMYLYEPSEPGVSV